METQGMTELALLCACVTWIIDKLWRIFTKSQSRNIEAIEKNTLAICRLEAQVDTMTKALYTVEHMKQELSELKEESAMLRAKAKLKEASN